ncbi:hypothetical protein N7452_003105 [Penicillium brevicompactum]|uniref:Uncharacterized protein n=1 Tax=Penicillium brevicompactum TaxID=5074 RepID=A0A9W9UJU6_PENBR|nr:hypothetical protein N7452_003105 [Penicillium brevicompactum]
MKVFNIILVAALAAFANAAAVANPEAAMDSAPLEKRCRAMGDVFAVLLSRSSRSTALELIPLWVSM